MALVDLSVVEQRYHAVLAVLAGARVSEVAAEIGVSRYRASGLTGWQVRSVESAERLLTLATRASRIARPLTPITSEQTAAVAWAAFLKGARLTDELSAEVTLSAVAFSSHQPVPIWHTPSARSRCSAPDGPHADC
ncbi:hypothetical protein SAMN05216276_105642 [Streptosporangium subroseum]|uniref:Uncharacterized protein n=1 Tax=Streptosporangium subroseum TaxID=106412 RepID=A0A239NG21_9ACTN|nr:hypothetical protein SAMN05216276_105642 [Streptosporangium subroseum]